MIFLFSSDEKMLNKFYIFLSYFQHKYCMFHAVGGNGDGGGGGGLSDRSLSGDPADEPINIGPDELKILKLMKLFSNSMNVSIKAAIKSADIQQVRTKVREPDPFSGSDPSKLRGFLIALSLNFQDRPAAFQIQFSKINYAISYVTGSALNGSNQTSSILNWTLHYGRYLITSSSRNLRSTLALMIPLALLRMNLKHCECRTLTRFSITTLSLIT